MGRSDHAEAFALTFGFLGVIQVMVLAATLCLPLRVASEV
jgi:hypothetical protein